MIPKTCIQREIFERLTALVRENDREEICGLLAGRDGVITRAFPAANAATKPATAYEIAPEELFGLMREIRAAGLELLGIYHSHPAGENAPSARDVERAYYPDAAYFILSPRPEARTPIRAFSLREGCAAELDIELTTS